MNPQNFLSHPIFQKLSDLRILLDSESAKAKIDVDRTAFFEAFYDFILNRLKSLNPILIREGDLNPSWNELEAGTQQINEFIGNNNDGSLQNAINHFHSAMSATRMLPIVIEIPNYDFAKVIADFQNAVKKGYDQLESINSQVKSDLSSYSEDLVNKQSQLVTFEKRISETELELQNQLSKFRTDFENIQNTSITNLDLDRKKFAELFDNDNRSFAQQFENDTRKYKDIFETELSTYNNEYLNQKNSIKNSSNELVEGTTKEFQAGIDNLNRKLTEANKIVNVIGNVGVTGNYQNIANQNKSNANIWRCIAIGFMALMSGLLIYSIIDLSSTDFNLYKSLVRILAAAVLTYPAIYAARESSKHRALETYNRNLELELASIGPFIEMLDEDKKQKIKEDLVNKYFGNQKEQMKVKEGDEELSLSALDKLVKIITPFLKK